MRLYTDKYSYNETIEMAKNLTGAYDDPVIYHCFWNGKLNDKHFISILSCFHFNVWKRKNRKIILWTDSPFEDNEILRKISDFCEVKFFYFGEEIINTDIPSNIMFGNNVYPIYSDRIRYVLLYKYGGVWFDLDMFFLKSLDTILSTFKEDICVYTWGSQNSTYPNNAMFINLEKKNKKMRHFIQFMIDRGKGFGFQESNLTYDLPVDLLVLPCSWFNAFWCSDFTEIEDNHERKISFFQTTHKNVKLDTFATGAFTYHWHNSWNYPIQENSYFDQLAKDLIKKFQ